MSELFSHTFGKLFGDKNGSETSLLSGDCVRVVIQEESSHEEQRYSVEVFRGDHQLWFYSHGEWTQAWSLGDIDAPDLFLEDVVDAIGLTLIELGRHTWRVCSQENAS